MAKIEMREEGVAITRAMIEADVYDKYTLS